MRREMARRSQERIIPRELVKLRYLTTTFSAYFSWMDQMERMRERYRQERERLEKELEELEV